MPLKALLSILSLPYPAFANIEIHDKVWSIFVAVNYFASPIDN